jgi:hypothetical protein
VPTRSQLSSPSYRVSQFTAKCHSCTTPGLTREETAHGATAQSSLKAALFCEEGIRPVFARVSVRIRIEDRHRVVRGCAIDTGIDGTPPTRMSTDHEETEIRERRYEEEYRNEWVVCVCRQPRSTVLRWRRFVLCFGAYRTCLRHSQLHPVRPAFAAAKRAPCPPPGDSRFPNPCPMPRRSRGCISATRR